MGEFFPLKMLPLTKPRKIEKRKWEKNMPSHPPVIWAVDATGRGLT